MNRKKVSVKLGVRALLLVAIALVLGGGAVQAQGVHFRIRIAPGAVPENEVLSGRLLIFMTAKPVKPDFIEPDYTDPNAVWISGQEVTNFTSDELLTVDADANAFPNGFSLARTGKYTVMALLDRDHSYTYNGMGPGDIVSPLVQSIMPATTTELTLSKSIPPPAAVDYPPNVKLIEFTSPLLSAFWGRPVVMRAGVVLPPDYDKSKVQRFPTVYSVHGYGGDHLRYLAGAGDMMTEMKDGKRPQMIYVWLNAHCSLGHHVFADSANDGPWGTALVKELIPYLEKQFRMDARPSGRFLTGHSSGGWSSLWIMVSHPDFFGGTWSSSPDPVDFRSFSSIDVTPPSSAKDAYRDATGQPYSLVRMDGKEVMSFEQYARQETVLGYYGGQLASFDAVFSPRGDDGQPMKLFDRETGRLDPVVQQAWERYDISRILRDNWKTLGPKLKGKLHIVVGTLDTFHLDGAVHLLDAELKQLGSDATVEFFEGKTHFDMYTDGLGLRIAQEMYAVARPRLPRRRR
jgi:enterochelin esterase-like enzyme